ncbi:hypothetical protein ACFOWZ_30285 [Lentzea rhizosphaerae]|uniref:Uncharacterized protein n=1 Tax=Lentzea rhizosphaerae TaxID=2041025 RepID=A0ABV8C1B1_9PSEU
MRRRAGDVVVAEEEGVVVVPKGRQGQVLRDARAKLEEEASQSLDDWEAEHRARIENALRDNGFVD